MRMITLDEVASLLNENDHYKLLTHSYPDGDTLGGAFALAFALRKWARRSMSPSTVRFRPSSAIW